MTRQETNSRLTEKIVIYIKTIRDIIETQKMYLETIREKKIEKNASRDISRSLTPQKCRDKTGQDEILVEK